MANGETNWERIEADGWDTVKEAVHGGYVTLDRQMVIGGGCLYLHTSTVLDNKNNIHVSESMCFVPGK